MGFHTHHEQELYDQLVNSGLEWKTLTSEARHVRDTQAPLLQLRYDARRWVMDFPGL